jgi:hypothetical protein
MLMPFVTNTLARKQIDKKNENCPLVLSTAGCLTCLKIEKVRRGNLTEKCMDTREGERTSSWIPPLLVYVTVSQP